MLILKTIISVIFLGTQLQAIEPPPPQQQVETTPNDEQQQDSQEGASSYAGTITPGGQSMTNVDDNSGSSQPSSSAAVSSGTSSMPNQPQIQGTSTDLNNSLGDETLTPPSADSQQPAMPVPSGTATQPSAPKSPGTAMQQAPSTAGTAMQETPSVDACNSLKNPEHTSFATQLTGNELTLFCSIFDDAQRDQAIGYVKNGQMSPKDAVIQVGKDSGILFSQTPGGACGAH